MKFDVEKYNVFLFFRQKEKKQNDLKDRILESAQEVQDLGIFLAGKVKKS